MQDNQTKTLYSFYAHYSLYSQRWTIDTKIKEWTVEKETPKTYTVTRRVYGSQTDTVTVRKATMEHFRDRFTTSRAAAIEKEKEIIAGAIERQNKVITDAQGEIENLKRVYDEIDRMSEEG